MLHSCSGQLPPLFDHRVFITFVSTHRKRSTDFASNGWYGRWGFEQRGFANHCQSTPADNPCRSCNDDHHLMTPPTTSFAKSVHQQKESPHPLARCEARRPRLHLPVSFPCLAAQILPPRPSQGPTALCVVAGCPFWNALRGMLCSDADTLYSSACASAATCFELARVQERGHLRPTSARLLSKGQFGKEQPQT